MQYKAFVVSALATLAAATPARRAPSQQCCSALVSFDDPAAQQAAALAGLNLNDISGPGLIGLNCSPITVIGGGTAGCNAIAAICDHVYLGGLLATGCTT